MVTPGAFHAASRSAPRPAKSGGAAAGSAFPSSSGEKVPPTYKYFVDIVNILRDMRPEKLTDKSILCGSPQHIIDTLKKVEAAGVAEVILYFNYGQKPHAQVKEQMDRFMRAIAPHFARRAAAA